MRQSAKETIVLRSQNSLLMQDYREAVSDVLLHETTGHAATIGLHAEQAKLFPRKTIH